MPGPGRPFQKGQSGNPAGRPRDTISLGEEIRRQLHDHDAAKLKLLVERQISIAVDPHKDAKARDNAARFLAANGYPQSRSGSVQIDDEARTITVTWQTDKLEESAD